MRINGRTWPAWAFTAVTVWFLAITVFWATKPLVDRVPTNVVAIAAAGQPTPPPGTRAEGPTIEIDCGTPAESKVTDRAANQARLAALVDARGTPLPDPQFSRRPCVGFHGESRILWFADIALYLAVVAALAVVVVRRRRVHHGGPELVGVGSAAASTG
jgi:hypothetical protein